MAIDTVVEEVADNLEEIAEATRKINTSGVAYFIGGAVVGAAIGFYFGYRYNKEKIKAEAFEESQKDVAKIREEYYQKALRAEKRPLEEIIEERGYSVGADSERPLPAPVPGLVDPRPVLMPKPPAWNYAQEMKGRLEGEPYVIHQDEFSLNQPEYNQVAYTYYANDDVLVDETERPLPHGDLVVGQNNLRFGHGTDDIDVVFVRNDQLERDMEICRVYKSYEQEVLGVEEGPDDDDDPDDD